MSKVNLPGKTEGFEKEGAADTSKLGHDNTKNGKNKTQSQSGAQYLLSIAGMFESTPDNSSENVESIISDLIQKKFGKTIGDLSD